ncbi:MAG: 16S rRNA (uracil(1498)-N(3))-methyltransferase [Planctomycetes bacterium]|nr:16S rRNA (uracil(1498)-N(3))-methyltransferase [Planctomycetota bacterium]
MTRGPSIARERWFFAPPQRPEALTEDDERHALRVLRLSPGERVVALDGRGAARELELVEVRGRCAVWRATGVEWREPAYGATRSELPWVELVTAPPKGARADELIDAATQLGVAALTFVTPQRTQGFERHRVGDRMERFTRIAREACKQAKRLHEPVLSGPLELEEALRGSAAGINVLLSPRAERRLAAALEQALPGTREAPWRLWIGPEGGWSESEEQQLSSIGALAARLSPHVLRVENAAAAAAAIALHGAWRVSESAS